MYSKLNQIFYLSYHNISDHSYGQDQLILKEGGYCWVYVRNITKDTYTLDIHVVGCTYVKRYIHPIYCWVCVRKLHYTTVPGRNRRIVQLFPQPPFLTIGLNCFILTDGGRFFVLIITLGNTSLPVLIQYWFYFLMSRH